MTAQKQCWRMMGKPKIQRVQMKNPPNRSSKKLILDYLVLIQLEPQGVFRVVIRLSWSSLRAPPISIITVGRYIPFHLTWNLVLIYNYLQIRHILFLKRRVLTVNLVQMLVQLTHQSLFTGLNRQSRTRTTKGFCHWLHPRRHLHWAHYIAVHRAHFI